jgi:uncharacterized protein (DUF952 family)
MLIYKILTSDQWRALERDGESAGAPVDLADGFVHFSTARQVAGTAAKHFAGQMGLMLLAVEAEALGEALKWEPSRGNDLFPHLYGRLRLADAAWARPLPLGTGPDSDGMHVFPEGVA